MAIFRNYYKLIIFVIFMSGRYVTLDLEAKSHFDPDFAKAHFGENKLFNFRDEVSGKVRLDSIVNHGGGGF